MLGSWVLLPVEVRHVIRVVRSTLALSGQEEAGHEAEYESADTGGGHRHGELLGAVSEPRALLVRRDQDGRVQARLGRVLRGRPSHTRHGATADVLQWNNVTVTVTVMVSASLSLTLNSSMRTED